MKKFLSKLVILLALVMLLTGVGYCAGGYAKAYTQDVSSWPVSTAHVAQFVCLISSAQVYTEISVIQLSVNSTSTAQTVTLYENCNSTKTATALWTVEIPAGLVGAIPAIVFPDPKPLVTTRGLVVRKSDPASNVKINVLTK